MGEVGVCKKVASAFMSAALVVGLMPLLAYANERGASASDGAGAFAITANVKGAALEAQASDDGPQVGKAVKGDTLNGVKIRFRPAGSHKPVSINDDGGGSQNVAHLYYNGKSSQFQLRKAGDDSYYFYFYQHYTDAEPKTSGDCVLDVERTKNDESYYNSLLDQRGYKTL